MKPIKLILAALTSTMLLSGCHVVSVRHVGPPVYVVKDRTIHHHTVSQPAVHTVQQQVVVQQIQPQAPARPSPKPTPRHVGPAANKQEPRQQLPPPDRPAPEQKKWPQSPSQQGKTHQAKVAEKKSTSRNTQQEGSRSKPAHAGHGPAQHTRPAKPSEREVREAQPDRGHQNKVDPRDPRIRGR